MAYAKLYMEHSNTPVVKTAPLGFSVTSLFFGPWVCVWRQDYFMIAAWVVIAICLTVMGMIWALFSLYPVQAFIYNKIYLQRLLNSGWIMRGWQGRGLEEIEFKLGFKLPRSVLTS
jgi:hypothetical protein